MFFFRIPICGLLIHNNQGVPQMNMRNIAIGMMITLCNISCGDVNLDPQTETGQQSQTNSQDADKKKITKKAYLSKELDKYKNGESSSVIENLMENDQIRDLIENMIYDQVQDILFDILAEMSGDYMDSDLCLDICFFEEVEIELADVIVSLAIEPGKNQAKALKALRTQFKDHKVILDGIKEAEALGKKIPKDVTDDKSSKEADKWYAQVDKLVEKMAKYLKEKFKESDLESQLEKVYKLI